jgi:hypothetical protein
VTTWDGLQSEAVAWVDAITKNNCWPTMIPNHCQTYRHVFDDHFVSQLMHPICYVSFSGLYGQDLEFSAEAPPLPAAGEFWKRVLTVIGCCLQNHYYHHLADHSLLNSLYQEVLRCIAAPWPMNTQMPNSSIPNQVLLACSVMVTGQHTHLPQVMCASASTCTG